MKIKVMKKQLKNDIIDTMKDAKSLADWDALEQAEKKTLVGKVKYAYLDYVYYPLYRVWYRVSEIPNEIKYFVQRGSRGYSDRDVWSIDYYLSSWMPAALKSIAKTGMSYPGVGAAKTWEQWKEIVEKMAKGFEASRKITDYEFNIKNNELQELVAQQKEGLKLFAKWYNALWD